MWCSNWFQFQNIRTQPETQELANFYSCQIHVKFKVNCSPRFQSNIFTSFPTENLKNIWKKEWQRLWMFIGNCTCMFFLSPLSVKTDYTTQTLLFFRTGSLQWRVCYKIKLFKILPNMFLPCNHLNLLVRKSNAHNTHNTLQDQSQNKQGILIALWTWLTIFCCVPEAVWSSNATGYPNTVKAVLPFMCINVWRRCIVMLLTFLFLSNKNYQEILTSIPNILNTIQRWAESFGRATCEQD